MTSVPLWFFNEKKLSGVDYQNQKTAQEYERKHSFRDFKKEADAIAIALALSNESVVLDIGCGTGNLSVQLASKCRKVYAVDVSDAMIAILNHKIATHGISNITTKTAGFLNYAHPNDPVDAIICNVALHHLPDFWKQIALIHFNRLLKENGKLFLGDILFDFPPDNYHVEIEGWLESMHNTAGRQMSDETITHIRDEYSTWNWVMAGMLARAGFHTTAHDEPVKNMHAYICIKNSPTETQPPVSGKFTT